MGEENGKMISGVKAFQVSESGVRGLASNHQMQAKKQLWGPNQTSGGKGKKKIWPNDRYCPQEKNE